MFGNIQSSISACVALMGLCFLLCIDRLVGISVPLVYFADADVQFVLTNQACATGYGPF